MKLSTKIARHKRVEFFGKTQHEQIQHIRNFLHPGTLTFAPQSPQKEKVTEMNKEHLYQSGAT